MYNSICLCGKERNGTVRNWNHSSSDSMETFGNTPCWKMLVHFARMQRWYELVLFSYLFCVLFDRSPDLMWSYAKVEFGRNDHRFSRRRLEETKWELLLLFIDSIRTRFFESPYCVADCASCQQETAWGTRTRSLGRSAADHFDEDRSSIATTSGSTIPV